jgi:hypothetical protein
LQNGVGQPVAGADQFLFFALVALGGYEHDLDRVPKAAGTGHDGCHSLKPAIYLIFAVEAACDAGHASGARIYV